jgi:hypothetical protein
LLTGRLRVLDLGLLARVVSGHGSMIGRSRTRANVAG